MPRHVKRPGHAVHQLIDLAEAKLVNIHASAVTVGEWKSQMMANPRHGLDEMHKGLQTAMRQEDLRQLKDFDRLSELANARERMLAEADDIVGRECDGLLKRLGLNAIAIAPGDAAGVFEDYFAGRTPFASRKSRSDIPDAFIFRAAKNLLAEVFPRELVGVCSDDRLAEALRTIEGMAVVKGLSELIESTPIQKAMSHLALSKLWTSQKSKRIIGFLRGNPPFATSAIESYASMVLPYMEFSDYAIPVDNNVATIEYVNEVENLEIDWDNLQQFGPGWLVVPFTFECDAGLSLQVYRADAFSMPDWVEVSIGDFEQDYYFEASARRRIQVSGSLSMQYNKAELERTEPVPPSEVEVEDAEICLVPHGGVEHEW